MAKQTDKQEGKKKRKQRVRSPHPGVVILKRKRATGTVYLARWIDPDTGRRTELSLSTPELRITNEEGRRTWAVNKSKSLAERRKAITSGTAVQTCTAPATAVSDFYETQATELKGYSVDAKGKVTYTSTLAVYREATTPFLAWAQKVALACIEDLTPSKLTAFRDWFTARPAHAQAKKQKRGARKASKRKRSAGQINKCLRSLRTVLNHWRKRGLTPALTSDAIRDHLEFVRAPKPLPHFLRADEIKALLEACQRHDAQLDDGKGHKHPPIMPFVVTALLSGCRFAELANLQWTDVDLNAGEIRLQHTATKTGHGRTIGLRESPTLATLLERRKLTAGENPYVFGTATTNDKGKVTYQPLRRDVAEAARKRLIGTGKHQYAAPKFTWHDLRRTTGTFLTCAGGIYGAASAFLSAKRLGHSVAVSEKHYAGALTNIPLDASTLEAAMGVADLCGQIAGGASSAGTKTG